MAVAGGWVQSSYVTLRDVTKRLAPRSITQKPDLQERNGRQEGVMAPWLRVFVFLVAMASTTAAQQKKRVAVFDFDYATVTDSVSGVFGTNVDVGKGVSDLIVENLVKSGRYSVIERKVIERIMAEQNFSNSDRVDSNAAAKVGKILGVDAIIIGS